MLFLVDELPPGDRFRLAGLRSGAARRARAHRPGQEVLLGNGRGGTARAVVTEVAGARLDLEVTGREFVPRPEPAVLVVHGVAGADRDGLAVAELTAAGAAEIAPMVPGPVADRWQRRDPAPYWRRVARDAAERSGQVWLPRIGAVYRSVVRRFEWGATGFVLDPTATESLSTVDLPTAGELVLVVPGDPGELAALAGAGAIPVRHDPPEPDPRTAAIAAATALVNRRISTAGH
ncbi:MAG TPA: hypothetical protein VFV67_10285 [Actinophytocola sp.]|uniref:hypothetical protein n=1 Tax=Actinophytocola sp. TaxID=1872138 RepID=UPI002DBFF6FF|nr:hypothetical protein [Actinophytocola sp.]HEU5471030.1 hypothetical protein [Actinophytocola sp.]